METAVKRQPPRVVVVVVNFIVLVFCMSITAVCLIAIPLLMSALAYKQIPKYPPLPQFIIGEAVWQVLLYGVYFAGFMMQVGTMSQALKDMTPGIVSAVERRARSIRSSGVQLMKRIDAIDIPAMIRERRGRR